MGSTLRSLLRDADPVRHEAPLPDVKREQLRLAILRNAAVDWSPRPLRARLIFASAIGMAVAGVMVLGFVGIWVPGTLLAAVRFEVRLAEETPIPGLIVAQVPNSSRLLYLHPEIVVSNDDIAQSWVTQDSPDQFGIAVQLLPPGAERMRQATATHVGRPVAILIDGNVVMAPVVRAPISDSAVVTGNFTRAEAERIAGGMKLR